MNTLLIIGIILLVLWLLGFRFFRGLGWLINIALIVAVILIIIWLLQTVFRLF
ncbi:MAG: lmo0937 family membrane protein [Chloroflexi bacterium]|nr:lmo0937 family membrane protein [Chloroflexota bacterium]